MGFCSKAEAIQNTLYLHLGLLDAFGDFYLLFTCEQGHLPHLFEIHAHWVIKNIKLAVLLFILFLFFVWIFFVLNAIYFRRFDDVNLHSTQLPDNGFKILWV